MQKISTLLLSATVIFAIAASASASIVAVSNLANGTSVNFGLPASGTGSTFTTGAGLFLLNSVDVSTNTSGGGAGGTSTYTAHLFTDLGGSPGSEIVPSLGAGITVGVTASSNDVVNLDFGSFALSAATTYWMVFTGSDSGTSAGSIWGTTNLAETSGVGWSIGDSTLIGSSFSFPSPILFAVNATAVPEPGTAAVLVMAGVFGALSYRPKRTRAISA